MDETYIGLAAGVCTSVSLLPQLIKIVREKKAENISYGMLGILLTGLILWVWYGFMKSDTPIIITNIISLVINCLVIVFTVKYKNQVAAA